MVTACRAVCSSSFARKNSALLHIRSVTDPHRQLLEQLAGAVQQPRLHQRREHRDVAARLRLAVVERPHAVTDLEPDVPQKREEPADRLVRIVLGRAVEQHEQVDVGLRMQLAAAVAADGDEVGEFAELFAEVEPSREDDLVDDLGARTDERLRSGRCGGTARQAARSLRAVLRGTRRRRVVSPRSARSSAARSISGERRRQWSSLEAGRHVSRAVRRAERQHLEAGLRYEHGVLPLRRQRMILGHDGPAVGRAASRRACRRSPSARR